MLLRDLPTADENGIIRALTEALSEINSRRINKFGSFMLLYDFIQNHWVRPRIHKADPKRHWKFMHELIAPIKEAVVLDIACGTGGAIPHFDTSNKYIGIDLSYAMLRQALKKVKAGGFREYALIEGNAEELLFPNECFDFVLIDTALHMIPKYKMCISEAARVLKKGKKLICSCPTVGLNKDFDETWKRISVKRDLNALTEHDIDEACSRSGMHYQPCNTNGGVLYFQAMKENKINGMTAATMPYD